jgi:hypothetical protein
MRTFRYSRQLLGVAFAGHDGFDDGQAGLAAQVTDDVVQLHVHLGQGLLHAQDLLGGRLHHATARA